MMKINKKRHHVLKKGLLDECMWVLLLVVALIGFVSCADNDASGPNPSPEKPKKQATETCSMDSECSEGLVCLTDPEGVNRCTAKGTPEGTKLEGELCREDKECQGALVCLTDREGMNRCTAKETEKPLIGACTMDADCTKPNHFCLEHERDGKNVKLCTEVTTAPDGAACTQDRDCQGGTCLTVADGFPEGYCTTKQCKNAATCHGVGADVELGCVTSANKKSQCYQLCETKADCREGYSCHNISHKKVCEPTLPEGFDDNFESVSWEEQGFECLELTQDGGALGINMEAGVESLFVTMRAKPSSLILYPAQISIDAVTTPPPLKFDYWTRNPVEPGNPLVADGWRPSSSSFLLPNSPKFSQYLVPGKLLKVDFFVVNRNPAADNKVCVKVIQRKSKGQTLDLNIYMAGMKAADGTTTLTAETAAEMPELKQALARVSEIYRQQGMTLGTVKFKNVPEAVMANYRNFKISFLEGLNAYSRVNQEENTEEGRLRLDVFLVESFLVDAKGTRALGVAAAIPGSATTHGTAQSGVVIGGDILYDTDGVKSMGHTIAHEIGHFLGLFHTTDFFEPARRWDPLPDTYKCTQDWWRCDDRTNLMFAYSPNDLSQPIVISDQQSNVMKRNPLLH